MRQSARLALYPLILIEGAENSTNHYREKFGIKGKFRVLPRYISRMKNIRTMEYDEIAVENNSLSFKEWLQLRKFHFLIYILSSDLFIDLNRELRAHDLDYASLAKFILEDSANWPQEITQIMNDFHNHAIDELMDEDEIQTEYSPDEPFDIELKYPSLTYYYFAVFASTRDNVDAFHKYLIEITERLYLGKVGADSVSNIRSVIDYCFDRFICYEDFQSSRIVSYNHDLDKWTADSDNNSVGRYEVSQKQTYRLTPNERMLPLFNELRSTGLKTHEIVYKMRSGFIGFRGDVVFAYDRTKIS